MFQSGMVSTDHKLRKLRKTKKLRPDKILPVGALGYKQSLMYKIHPYTSITTARLKK